jgi:hypothetical protein
MAYDAPLPSIRKLRQLADWGGPYPIENRRMILVAERFGLGDKVINFLDLFTKNTIFQSREDFLYQCEVMGLYVKTNQKLPADFIDAMFKQIDLAFHRPLKS